MSQFFIEITAYKNHLIFNPSVVEEVKGAFYPQDEYRIGAVVVDTKKSLRISEAALKLIAAMPRGTDDLGDFEWWRCNDGTCALAWIGANRRAMGNIATRVTARDTHIYRDACTIIPNRPPQAAKDVINAHMGDEAHMLDF